MFVFDDWFSDKTITCEIIQDNSVIRLFIKGVMVDKYGIPQNLMRLYQAEEKDYESFEDFCYYKLQPCICFRENKKTNQLELYIEGAILEKPISKKWPITSRTKIMKNEAYQVDAYWDTLKNLVEIRAMNLIGSNKFEMRVEFDEPMIANNECDMITLDESSEWKSLRWTVETMISNLEISRFYERLALAKHHTI